MHQPTERVLEILDLISKDGRSWRLADLHRELDIPKSTLLPILQTLCAHKYLAQDSAGLYGPGNALFSLGTAFTGKYPILAHVRKKLTEMSQKFGETYYFGVLEDGYVLYLDKVESTSPLRMLISTGRRLPAYATGIGKALLLDKTEAELVALYGDTPEQLTKNTITDMHALHTQLTEARQLGYAWEVEESMEHVRCFSAPVRKHGQVIAAISIAIPTFRYDDGERDSIVGMLTDTARKIGETVEATDAHFGNLF